MSGKCHVEPIQKIPTAEESQVANSVRLTVYGMGCHNCATRVSNGLLSVKGVLEAQVDHLSGMAQVTFNPQLTTIPTLLEAVERSGADTHHRYMAITLE